MTLISRVSPHISSFSRVVKMVLLALSQRATTALLNFEMSMLTQKHHPYTGNLNRETVKTRFYIVEIF